MIRPEETVGIRWTTVVRKVVGDKHFAVESKPNDVGVFGRRPVLSSSRLADDVLAALRLLKAGLVWSPSTAGSSRAWMLEGGTSFSHRPGRKFRVGNYTLNEEEVTELQRLWKALTSGVLERKRFRFLEAGLRRFNFAFDRFASEDRLVDLLIAAESLFLHDGAVPPERGELRFRLALRASKFIKHPTYTERETYKLMRRAYDARSAVVHGGEASDTRLRGQKDAPLTQFTDAVEEIMRRALREAMELASADTNFGTADYWEALLFENDKGGSTVAATVDETNAATT
jgi:hypothetical protein